jgi:TonB family protein
MYKVVAAVVVASVSVAGGSAQSTPDPWPPPGVIGAGGPGVTRPVPISRVQPPYTPAAQRQRIQGVVSVACVIEPDGTVGPTRVVQSLDNKLGLDEQALATVKKWRFKPGSRDGAPARMLTTVNLVFSIPGEPPPSTWPALLGSGGSPAIDTSQWREETAEAKTWRVRVRYPETWRADRRMGNLLQFDAHDGEESIAIQEPFTMPGPLALPVSVDRLEPFSEAGRKAMGAADLDSLGVGQGLASGRWWVWQELQAPPSHFARLGLKVDAEFERRYEGGRLWHFTTIVGNDMVSIVGIRKIRSGQDPKAADEELRESGRLFDQILRRITFSTR